MNEPLTQARTITRRALIRCMAAGFALLSPVAAWADERSDRARAAIEKLLGGRVAEERDITLKTPSIAENGNTVPVSVSVDVPITAERWVKAVHLIAEENPQPEVASFYFTPASGKASASTRIRLAKTQHVIAVAELSDGNTLLARKEVKVTIGGCGG